MSPRHVPASVSELQRIGLFGSLPGETIVKLAGRMVREEFPAGTPIVVEGDLHRPLLRPHLGPRRRDPGGARRTRDPASGRGLRRGGAADADGAHRDGHRDDDVRRRELRPRDVRRAAAAALRLRLSTSSTTASESSGQATLAQSPNLRVVSAAQARPWIGIDPEERAAAAEVPERPRRGERARPVALPSLPSARRRGPSRAG